MSAKLSALFNSRRFWAAVAGLVVVVTKDTLQLPFTEEQVQGLVMLIAAWVVGDSINKTE